MENKMNEMKEKEEIAKKNFTNEMKLSDEILNRYKKHNEMLK